MRHYDAFLTSKRLAVETSGFAVEAAALNPALFDFQRDITRWALQLGKAALFCGTGLGKTLMQLEWSHRIHLHSGGDVLIVAPLAVAQQTAREGAKFGIVVTLCRSDADARPGINITNYERLHLFDPAKFVAVVLDESSILKAYDGKTRNQIIDLFAATPYKLACTATPAPNDYMELGNHAEFLGVMSRVEMLSMFFVHDGGETQKWRLKGHAEPEFWRWVCSWAVMLRAPSDLGYEDGAFRLPPLRMHQHTIESDTPQPGMLFAVEAKGLIERKRARKASLAERVGRCVRLVTGSAEQWLIWVDLNAEQDAIAKALGPDCVSIEGSTPMDERVRIEELWRTGKVRILVTKPAVFGFGLNWQHCANVAFVGLSDSWEAYYQAIRRCWRFGQTRPVECHVITATTEGAVVANIERKERDAAAMAASMVAQMSALNRAALGRTERQRDEYAPAVPMIVPDWVRSEAA